MKKILLTALLLLALAVSVAACTNDAPLADTTTVETTATPEEPTAAPTDAEESTVIEEPSTAPETTVEPETTQAPETTKEPETTKPVEEETPAPKPEEPLFKLNTDKTEYVIGEPIMITAYGSGKDWVGIANRGADKSIAWYYVDEVSGQSVNFFDWAQDGAGNHLSSLPSGEYTVYLIPNDQNLAGSTPIGQIDITISNIPLDELPIWNGADLTHITHIAHDVLRWDDGANQGTSLDKEGAVIADATSIMYGGWIGATAEIGVFGYQINGSDIVWNDEWTTAPEDAVVNAAAGTGASHASRFYIHANVADVLGEHTIAFLYKTSDESIVVLTRAVIIGADADESPV